MARMSHPERSRGPGLSGLTDLGRSLSERDGLVLDLVAAHRFMTTRHLESFCFQDHTTSLSAARSCRRVLARLEAWGLLDRPIRRVGGLHAGSASSIWMLTSTGQRLRNLRAGIGAIGRVREPGERFIAHYLAIADTHLALVTAERAGRLKLSEVQIEPASWRHYSGLGGNREVLKPDLFVITSTSEYDDHWFIEVDRATESIPTLLTQCQQYERYRRQGTEVDDRGVFPLVLWIVPDERRATKLRTAIDTTRGLDRELHRIATPETFLDVAIGGET
jgi:hypothetical protein